MKTPDRAPVQADRERPAGTIPWEVHDEAHHGYARATFNGQSVVKIAERGGFGYRELQCALAGHYGLCWGCRESHPDVPGWEPL